MSQHPLEPLHFELRQGRGGTRAYPTNDAAKKFVAVIDQTTLTVSQLREFETIIPITIFSLVPGHHPRTSVPKLE